MATLTAPHGADLTDWFARFVPDGSTVEFEPAEPGDDFESGVHIVDKKHVTVNFIPDGDKPHIVLKTDGSQATPPKVPGGYGWSWPRHRVALAVHGDHLAVRLNGPVIHGGNPHAGLGDDAYDPAYDAQHGIEVMGGQRFRCDGYVARDVRADFFYLGGGARDVLLHDFDFARNGRQGISVTNAANTTIALGHIHDVRRTVFDPEPNLASDVVSGLLIRDIEVGDHRLNLLSSYGHGDVSHVTVSSVQTSGTGSVQVRPPVGVRRRNWFFESVTATAPVGNPQGAAMQFTAIDGLTISNCDIALAQGRDMVLVHTSDCTGVALDQNQWPGGVGESR